MSEAKRLINRAISLLLQGQYEGAEYSLEQALGEVDNLVSAVNGNRWQPIETAPKDGEKILIAGGTYGCEFSPDEFYGAQNRGALIVIWCNHRKHFAADDFHYNPTHWMPLPKPPTNETLENLRAAGLSEPAN